MNEKQDRLKNWLGNFENIAIAFSGGVDSTYLLAIAKAVHKRNVLAVTVKTPYIPIRELEESITFCRVHDIRHHVIYAGMIDTIASNPENRCYLCKHHLFSLIKKEAAQLGFVHVFDGSNSDDANGYRPGLKALKELGIRSPLLENQITKKEVRFYSEAAGLSTSSKPSYACLLTRFPYHSEIGEKELKRVEQAEDLLAGEGYTNARVRNHANVARIEIEKEALVRFMQSDSRQRIIAGFHDIGYEFITVDLEGYRSGSFDIQINQSYNEQ